MFIIMERSKRSWEIKKGEDVGGGKEDREEMKGAQKREKRERKI